MIVTDTVERIIVFRARTHQLTPVSGALCRHTLIALALLAGCATTHATEPPPVTISTARRVPRPTTAHYETYWSAVADMNIKAAHSLAHGVDEHRFADALGAMLTGNSSPADTALRALRESATDSTVRMAARVAHGALLYYQGEWEQLVRMGGTAGGFDSLTIRDGAGVDAWGAAFGHAPPQVYTFPAAPVVLPLTLSPSGAPTIPVRVNGHTQQFWIDTGSSFTVLASDIAHECRVLPATTDTLQAQGAVARIPAAPAIIASLVLGDLEIDNAPAMIIDAANLKLADQARTAALQGMPPPKIDGIIGFDVIRRLDLEIDYAHSRVILRRPAAPATPGDAGKRPRNLFWFGIPIVELFTPQGIAVHLLLDTGADETYATPPMLTKVEERPEIGERREINGFGKSVTARGVVLPGVKLLVGGSALRLERTFLYSADYPTLFTLDGTLGSDVGRTGRIRIDMTNGRFDVLPANAPDVEMRTATTQKINR